MHFVGANSDGIGQATQMHRLCSHITNYNYSTSFIVLATWEQLVYNDSSINTRIRVRHHHLKKNHEDFIPLCPLLLCSQLE
ncbi:Hypothetical predicted protein [Podarcis lilfordi]|uniref:Uncharacterized protein n=1 Tax=Podarcis lilfordi TaxID=74358 RepID=A0AA35KBU0_9SAUR|nr:Hypothetical predicted protein [Podarcis lilfordi]